MSYLLLSNVSIPSESIPRTVLTTPHPHPSHEKRDPYVSLGVVDSYRGNDLYICL